MRGGGLEVSGVSSTSFGSLPRFQRLDTTTPITMKMITTTTTTTMIGIHRVFHLLTGCRATSSSAASLSSPLFDAMLFIWIDFIGHLTRASQSAR